MTRHWWITVHHQSLFPQSVIGNRIACEAGVEGVSLETMALPGVKEAAEISLYYEIRP